MKTKFIVTCKTQNRGVSQTFTNLQEASDYAERNENLGMTCTMKTLQTVSGNENQEKRSVIRKRVVSPNINYKSNWYTDEKKVLEKLMHCQKKYPNDRVYVIEEKRVVEQASYEYVEVFA